MKKVLLENTYTWENSGNIDEDVSWEIEKLLDENNEFPGTVTVTVEYEDYKRQTR